MIDPKNGHARGEKTTLVEEGTEFKGTLASNCPILIKGKVDGEVSGPSLHISPSGAVSGTVKVRELESEGELAGQCEADIVRLSGRVKDRTVIRAKTLEMKVASDKGKLEVMFGECELEVGDAPSKEEPIQEPKAAKEEAKAEPAKESPALAALASLSSEPPKAASEPPTSEPSAAPGESAAAKPGKNSPRPGRSPAAT
jgi:cytoskeletal protein CcmA (bactofilin family)